MAKLKHRPKKHKPAAARTEGPVRQQHIALVYNPSCCCLLPYKSQAAAEAFLKQLLEPLELDYELIAFEPENLADLPERLSGCDTIWVAGGDGTILTVAAISKKLDLPLGLIPTGTMNMLARDLGISLDLPTAVKQLSEAQVARIDVAEVNGEPFLCMSNLGLATRFSKEREKMRHRSLLVRWPSVFWNSITALFNYPVLSIEIETPGKRRRVKTRAISIANNSLAEERGPLPGRKSLDSGKLALYITGETSSWSMLRLFSRLLIGTWKRDPELKEIHAQEVTLHIRSKRKVTLMNDGEISSFKTPLRYRIYARSLPMLKPEVTI